MAAQDVDMTDAAGAADDSDLSTPGVPEKYNVAALAANAALTAVIGAVAAGKKIVELCKLGDETIKQKTGESYKSSKIEKGIAFPTCVSVNNCCGHYSPLEDESIALAEGDLVKIDLGAHVDGFIAVVAHTVVVGGGEVTGRKADAIAAAHNAAEVVVRALKAGGKGGDVAKLVDRVITSFQCTPLDGVASHQLKKFTIEGPKSFMNKGAPERKIPECTFEVNEVYGVDICVSTGDGRSRDADSRVTVFKRLADNSYALKLKTSRQLYHDVKAKHPHLPFSLRDFDVKGAKMGVIECVRHELLQPYPVLFERDGEYVAQFKFTVLVTANGARRITGGPAPTVTSEHKIEDEELVALLATAAAAPKKKKKPAAAAAGGAPSS